ncbi:uncharacterized protein N7482_008901 [Penicillium canariense]|uniref:Yeast cell wall synthesis Kre9/Knh1-like N-terminal domain-containing protein n=1 Tax=Penicillium canariense TaxID=189055 RepID=A0A9W9HUN0_9EURO|nr:uncharacterized protein N7482_008901 [Penicillium canariense]KAJ5157801.1 hypothetical protein N7482_008901 [Penicillium canariense]
MHFTSVLAVSATLFAVAYANDPLAFTAWPKDIQAGKPVTLTWAGGAPDQPVTLTLRKGTSGNLHDVEVITAQAKDGTFTWTPGDNVKSGEDYAFQIRQGGEANYSALLKAGPAEKQVSSESSQTKSAINTNSAQSSDTTSGNSATQASPTTSKPLISSSAVAPFSSPASSTTVTSSVTATVPFETSHIMNGKEATATGSMQSGAASPLRSYSELVVGALGLLVYLVQ